MYYITDSWTSNFMVNYHFIKLFIERVNRFRIQLPRWPIFHSRFRFNYFAYVQNNKIRFRFKLLLIKPIFHIAWTHLNVICKHKKKYPVQFTQCSVGHEFMTQDARFDSYLLSNQIRFENLVQMPETRAQYVILANIRVSWIKCVSKRLMSRYAWIHTDTVASTKRGTKASDYLIVNAFCAWNQFTFVRSPVSTRHRYHRKFSFASFADINEITANRIQLNGG